MNTRKPKVIFISPQSDIYTLVSEYELGQELVNVNTDSQEDLEIDCSTHIKEHKSNLTEVAADDTGASADVIPLQLEQDVKENEVEEVSTDAEIHVCNPNDDAPATTQL